MPWVSSGRITNPALNQVLVDTGPLTGGARSFQVFASANVDAVFEIQLRDATNTTTLKDQILAVPAMGTASLGPLLSDPPVADGERLRVIQVGAVTGNVSVSVDYS